MNPSRGQLATYCHGMEMVSSMRRRRPWSRLTESFVRTRAGTRPGVTVLGFDDVATEQFARQLDHIAAHARVVTLDEAVRGLSREDPAIGNTVVLTFADGSLDFTSVVLPALVRRHLPATLYVATASIEERYGLPGRAPPIAWSGVGQALATGLVTIGAQSHMQRRLDRATDSEAAEDIQRAVDLIAARTGRVPLHFAYPQGALGSPATRRLVEDIFHSATAGSGLVNPLGATDLHRLVRSPVSRHDQAGDIALGLRPAGRARR